MKKIISVLVACSMLMILFGGCRSEKTTVSIYFKDVQTNSLNKEERNVKISQKASAADIAKLAVAELIRGPRNEKNREVISSEAKLLSLVVNHSVATVNISKHFLEKKGVERLLLRLSMINTLCSIDGIDGIVIQVEGEPLVSESTGKEYGVLSMADIALNTEDNTTVKLYFPDRNGENLVLEERVIDAQNALSLEKTVVSELIKGPRSKELSSSISGETKLLGIETKDKVCYVNFSSEFKTKTNPGSAATTMTLYSVVNSLCALDSVDSVQILINGENGVEFGNFVLDIPYEENTNLVE